MNVRFQFVVLLSVAVASLGLMAGCGQNDQTDAPSDSDGQQAEGVDPHDVPITEEQEQQLREETAKFADAVARIKKFRDVVEEETKDGLPANPFTVHQALDKADLVTQWLPKIAQDSGIAIERLEAITLAAEELRELFDKVHLNIDKKADPDFASVKQQMATRIALLETIAL